MTSDSRLLAQALRTGRSLDERFARFLDDRTSAWHDVLEAALAGRANRTANDAPTPGARAVEPFASVLWNRFEQRPELALCSPAAVAQLKDALRAHLTELARPVLTAAGDEVALDRALRSDPWVLLRATPVLGRMLAIAGLNCIDAFSEFLIRFARDRGELLIRFPGSQPRIAGVLPIRGDAHNGGRRTIVFTAGARRLVYKPRPCEADIAFDRAHAEFARRLGDTARAPVAHVRGAYAWFSFVEREPSDDLAVLAQRYGRLAALCTALRAVDFHTENVIATQNHPIPIDADALFQVLGDDTVTTALWRSGLAPRWVRLPDGRVDPSALGACVESPTARLNAQSLPLGADGCVSDFSAHLDEIVGAFLEAGSLLVSERSRRLGGLTAFHGIRTRAMLRETYAYVRLRDEIAAAPALTNADDALARLQRTLRFPESGARIAAHELVALYHGDIPTFGAVVDGRHLLGYCGVPIPDVFANAPIDLARLACDRLSDSHFAEAAQDLRRSFAERFRK